jgi:quercetin dioxygenase-like cupin family protein
MLKATDLCHEGGIKMTNSNFYFEEDINVQTVEEGKVTRRIKAHDGKMMMVEVYFENGAIGYNHVHDHEQSTYCLEGEFEFIIGEENKIIKTGDTVYIPPMVDHGCRLKSERGRLLDVFTPQREDFLK